MQKNLREYYDYAVGMPPPATPEPLAGALECAARNWAVFPVSASKVPRTPNGHKAASTDPERIKAMHAQFGFVLVGIQTGEASDLAVLDIDLQQGGAEWWKEHRHRIPPTRTHRTRGGGLHLFFHHRLGLKCSTARIAPGVDVKAEGGSIIYWPAFGLPILYNAPLAAWPEWLAPPAKAAPPPCNTAAHPRPAEHIEAQLAGLVRTIAGAAEGQRNATLFWGAARAAELVSRGELSAAHATAVMIEAASKAGLDRGEAEATIKSALRSAGRA